MNLADVIRTLNREESNLFDTTLQFIHRELDDLLKDLAKVNLLSAEQAFLAASNSNNPEIETRIGIGHLRNVYNAFQVYHEKGRKTIWGRMAWKRWPEDEIAIQYKVFSTAPVIALLYKRLDDDNNYIIWKRISLNYSTNYLPYRKRIVNKWQEAIIRAGTGGSYPDSKKREAHKPEMKLINELSILIEKI